MTKVSDIQCQDQKAAVIHNLKTAIQQEKPCYIVRTLGWNKDRDYIEYEILSLPFTSNDEGIADRILCFKKFRNKL